MKNKYFQFSELNNDSIVSLYTKIPFNFSRKYVNENNINSQFKQLEKDMGVNFKCIKYMKQVHGNSIKIVKEKDLSTDCYENYDGLLTDIDNVALTTITADCQSLFLYDKKKGVIGNIHSGWKGTLKRIVREAISLMKEEYSSNVKDIIVCINPSILDCCFEVEDDVIESFKEEFGNIDKYIIKGNVVLGKQKYYLDTILINVDELVGMGISKKNIILSNVCTKCNSDIFHSYRVEGIGTGQNLAIIMKKS